LFDLLIHMSVFTRNSSYYCSAS